ncbi:hypothetical protein [Granulicella arctica]|uniref:hypothetical protein n=1 Tax=Granulicella arctica TaxID=940613 RepID=UPI0021DF4DC2|nr:hypothetical protein [Granulicella arctica]
MKKLATVMLGMVLCGVADAALAQLSTPTGIPPQSARTPYGAKSREDENPMAPNAMEQIEKGRQTERQKKLIADTDRLLALANELKMDMDKTTKDAMSIQVIKKAEEIEKLARNVKERMKG